MKKLEVVVLLILCSVLSLMSQVTDVTFPYNLPLTTGDGLQTFNFTGRNTAGETVTLPQFTGKGMLVAIDKLKSSFSGAYFKDLAFNTEKGFVIEFIYEFYTGGMSSMNRMGDGFALVLFDASSPFSIGANGSGLGYAYNRKPGAFQPGLSGGFLGIGFDVYGAYKNMGFPVMGDPVVDYRTGLMAYNNYGSKKFGGATTDFVTIRGPVNPSAEFKALFRGDNLAGYPLLFSQNTYNATSPASALKNVWLNNTWTGKEATMGDRQPGNAYTASDSNLQSFTIAGGEEDVHYPSKNFRKVRIEMIPDVSNAQKMYVNVFMTTTDAQNPMKVVDKYVINLGATIRYPEMQEYKNVANPMNDQIFTPAEMVIAKPSKLKIGWTASTGEAWANIILKDASITLPYAPIVANDNQSVCNRIGTSKLLDPLANDYGYGAGASPNNSPVPSKDNLDKNSFRFMVPKGAGNVGYKANSTPHVYENAYAKYTYDKTTGFITVVTKTNIANNTTDLVYYDIKDKYRTSEDYRSKVATITYTYLSSECSTIESLPAPNATDDVVNICNTINETKSIMPLSNDVGYAYNTNSAVISGTGQYLNTSSFNFTNASGVASSTVHSASTANASYSYSNGVLTVKMLRNATSGTSDVLYYTVTNSGSTTRSNVAKITINFKSSECSAVQSLPAPNAIDDVVSICNTINETKSIMPLSNDIGYAYNTSSVIVSGTGQYLNTSSFSFTNSSGIASSNVHSASTVNANYSYNNGTLIITVLRNVSSGVSDVLYYTVTNSGSTTRSNVAKITVNFLSSECSTNTTLPPPYLRFVIVENICPTAGNIISVNAFKDSYGWSIENGVAVQGVSYIDKTSFWFTDDYGSIISLSSLQKYTSEYAEYTYNPTTGYIDVKILANNISGKYEDVVRYTVTNKGSTDRSNVGALGVEFNTASCLVKNAWIRINGSKKGMFLNGIGDLPHTK